MKPLALDLFCGAGGASQGLVRGGFRVLGIDLHPQPRYPYAFIQGDALTFPIPPQTVFVWASPCCQRFSTITRRHGRHLEHPDYIAPIRAKLRAWGGLYVIENVPGAPLIDPVILDGGMFGLNTYQRRHFEANFPLVQLPQSRKFGPRTRLGSVSISGNSGGTSTRDGWTNGTKADWQKAMGIDWMLNRELAEAIPPAYAAYVTACVRPYLANHFQQK